MIAPTVYRVTARTASDRTSSITAGDTVIPLDSAWQPASPSGLPGPAELLSAALAGCLLKGLERARAMMPFEYDSAEVTITAHRQDVPPKFTELEYELRIVTAESERRVDLLHRNLQQFGTIYNTLAAACDVHGTIVVVDS
ncbi:MAG TPA: OsmC family protein [Rhodoglobus sp.]|nr:OsmC family protein [Rhodoglobus sp.]